MNRIFLICIFAILVALMTENCCRSDDREMVAMECIERSATGDERWVTGRGDAFLVPSTLKQHFNADWIIDGKSICKYKLRWFSGSYSQWFYPGLNDNPNTGKHDEVWNNQHYMAGRRSWSMFQDHTHTVCYCDATTPNNAIPVTQDS